MKRAPLLLLLVAAVALADRTPVQFRLQKDPQLPVRGYLSDYNDEGFLFEFMDGRKAPLRWDDLVAEDARALRIRFRLELTEDEKLGLVAGHRLHFKGGISEEGLSLGNDERGNLRFKVRGLVLTYPADRIDRLEEVKLREDVIYDEEEIYDRQLERTPPQTAVQHRALADRMFEVGNFLKAREHYQKAVETDPALQAEVQARLDELKDYMADAEAQKTISEALSQARLFGEYDRSIAALKAFMEAHPERNRAAAKALAEVQSHREIKVTARFLYVKHQEVDKIIERYLTRTSPKTVKEATSWVTSELSKELERRVRDRMNFDERSYQEFLARRGNIAPHYATYWSGSFILTARTSGGKQGKYEIRGDPDRWWASYDDPVVRRSFLKAYAAEKLTEVFEVVVVRNTDCEKCGGRGKVKQVSLTSVKALGGAHEWWETCDRCFGCCQDRAIGYR